MRRKTHEEFLTEISSINPNIKIHGRYVNSRTKIQCECKICGYYWNPTPNNLLSSNSGCPVCSGNTVGKGINDLWTTHPHIAKLLKNPSDGYICSHANNSKKYTFICPICNCEIDKFVGDVCFHGLSCPSCSDGYSYPEKLMFNILKDIGIKFQTQKNFGTKHKYDFFINSLNCIIETHGLQHYENMLYTLCGKTLQEEQLNDIEKMNIALENNIKHYIVIDCRKSELEYIKKSIMQSELPSLLNFKERDVDWNKCDLQSQKSIMIESCRLWNEGKTKYQIADLFQVAPNTIITYLKRGAKLGICNYDKKNEIEKNKIKCSKPVLCRTTNIKYKSISDASRDTGVATTSISGCCIGKYKYTKHNGIRLEWCYC